MYCRLDQVAEVVAGNPAPQGHKYFEGGKYNFVRVYDMGENKNRTYIEKTRDLVNDKAVVKLRLFPQGSVLFTKSGASTLLNQRAILSKDSYIVSHIAAAIPFVAVEDKWIFYFLNLVDFSTLAHATNMPSLPLSRAKSIEVPLAPEAEQCRIVSKIEELFSELDKGVESLKKARKQLKVYRQAVLKHAFEGKLTAKWREENQDKLEKPEQLLARIKREREARYEQQLEEWKAAVKTWEESCKSGKKTTKPKKLPEIADIPYNVIARLPQLPDGWLWVRLGDIADVHGGLTKNQKRNNLSRNMKYLRVANVYADKILADDVHIIGVTDEEVEKVMLEVGDLLIVEGNGSIEQIGRVAMWGGELPVCGHQNHLIKVRLATKYVPRFFLQFLLSPLGRDLIIKESSSTSGLHTLSISKVSNLVVPITNSAEESAVVIQIDEKIAKINLALKEVDSQLVRSKALHQSILKKAFAGQLVAQDPHEEPASVLLSRIKAEKAAQSHTTINPKRRRRAITKA